MCGWNPGPSSNVAPASCIACGDAVRVVFEGDADRDHVVREVLRQVGERLHLAVREDVHGALLVAQHDRAQVHLLDQPALAVDDRHVADAHLVLEDQEEPGDDVAHERLRAEADAPAPTMPAPVSTGVMSTSSSRSTISPAMTDDDDGERLLQQAAERLRALGALDDVEPGAAAHLALEAARRRRADADHQVGGDAR